MRCKAGLPYSLGFISAQIYMAIAFVLFPETSIPVTMVLNAVFYLVGYGLAILLRSVP